MSQHRPCDLPTAKSTNSFWHTEPSTLLNGHRSTRDLPKRADLVIIGSGITGASLAHHIFEPAAMTGDWRPDVVMLEAREACWGATGRNGGHCQPLLFEHPHDPSVGHFELNNYATLRALIAERSIDCEWVSQPGIRGIYGKDTVERVRTALSVLEKTAPELKSYMRLITKTQELDHYRLPTADAAVYTTIAARLWPYKLVAHILESLLLDPHLKGRFNLQTLTPVDSIKQEGSKWLVNTSRGTIEARNVLLATNAYTSHLLPSYADLVVPCRGQMSALLPPPALSGAKRLQSSIGFEGEVLDDYLIQRPLEGGEQLMFGGGRHLGPSLGISDDSCIDGNVAHYLRTALPKRLCTHGTHAAAQENGLRASHEWTGVMAWSRDHLPWVGAVPDTHGLYMSVGYTGHGMPNAWLCGKAVVAMMIDEAKGAARGDAIRRAQAETGLPDTYILSSKRVDLARNLKPLEMQGPESTLQSRVQEDR